MSSRSRPAQSRYCTRGAAAARARLAVSALALGLLLPAAASAHGPVDPAASSYLARIATAPPGTVAKVIDGDQRMSLRANPAETLVVLDYRGAPYLRFSPAGVQVNRSSSMYYLNQVPAQIPPPRLQPATPPRWSTVSRAHQYSWHDGRLHALASTARAPGTTYLGHWRVPVRVNGSLAAIGGGLFYAEPPSIVWFWPIVVVVACVLAVVRLRRSQLDLAVARGLAAVALAGFVVAGAGRQLHGRPTVSAGQLIVLGLVLAFAVWALRRLVQRRHGWFTFFLVAVAAIWQGATLVTVLLDGFVLVDLPPFLARAVVVACLAAGAGLLVLVFRMAERPGPAAAVPTAGRPEPEDELDFDDEHAWEV